MFSTIVDRALLALLVASIFAGLGTLVYAQHEHGQVATLRMSVQDAKREQKQAEADRDAALQAAAAAQKQQQAVQDAIAVQAKQFDAAQHFAVEARAKIGMASKSPQTAKILETPVPKEIWDAIYQRPGE